MNEWPTKTESITKYQFKIIANRWPVKKWKKRFLNSKNYGSALNLSSIFFFLWVYLMIRLIFSIFSVCSSTFLVCMYVIYKMMCNGWMNLLNIQKKIFTRHNNPMIYKKKCSYADSHDSRRCCCFHDIMMSQMSSKNLKKNLKNFSLLRYCFFCPFFFCCFIGLHEIFW